MSKSKASPYLLILISVIFLISLSLITWNTFLENFIQRIFDKNNKIIEIDYDEVKEKFRQDSLRIKIIPNVVEKRDTVFLDYYKSNFFIKNQELLDTLLKIKDKYRFGNLNVQFGINYNRDKKKYDSVCLSITGVNFWDNNPKGQIPKYINNCNESKLTNYRKLIAILKSNYVGGFNPNYGGVKFDIDDSIKWLEKINSNALIYIYPSLESPTNGDEPFSTVVFSNVPNLRSIEQPTAYSTYFGNRGHTCCQ